MNTASMSEMIRGQRLKKTFPLRLHQVSTSAYIAPNVRMAFISGRWLSAGRSSTLTSTYPTTTPNQRILTVIDSAASSQPDGSRIVIALLSSAFILSHPAVHDLL